VKPGESGKIPIKISTKKGSGPLSKSITVNTNIAGKDATLRLTIKGEVWQPVQVSPPSAAFGRITAAQANDDIPRKLTIINNIEGELKLTNVRSTSPSFKAEIKPLEPGKKFELLVSIVPPLKEGNNTGKITIETGLEEPATIEVPVYAFVTAPVDVTPTQLNLTSGRSAPMKRQFYIRCHDNKPFEVTNVKCTSKALTMNVVDMRGNKQTYQLVVDIPADYEPSAGGDEITFDTTHPAQPHVTIPISQKSRATPRAKSRLTPGGKPAAALTGKGARSPSVVKPIQPGATGEQKPSEVKKPAEVKKPMEMKPAAKTAPEKPATEKLSNH